MIRLERYTGDKTYMFPNSTLATPEVVRGQYPAVAHFVHVVETDGQGEVLFALESLAALRAMNGIDPELEEAEAIAALETLRNTPPILQVRPEARMAEALETLAAETQIAQAFDILEGGGVDA